MQQGMCDVGASTCLTFTCVSVDREGLLFLLDENKFHNPLQRKEATRHTLPTIHISLSLRRFSMVVACGSPLPHSWVSSTPHPHPPPHPTSNNRVKWLTAVDTE